MWQMGVIPLKQHESELLRTKDSCEKQTRVWTRADGANVPEYGKSNVNMPGSIRWKSRQRSTLVDANKY